MLRNYYGLFNNMVTSILSIACLAENPKGNQCGNIINYFELITLGNISLNLQMFLYRQSRGTCEPMGKVRQNILEILSGSDDETLNNLINSEMTILSIY